MNRAGGKPRSQKMQRSQVMTPQSQRNRKLRSETSRAFRFRKKQGQELSEEVQVEFAERVKLYGRALVFCRKNRLRRAWGLHNPLEANPVNDVPGVVGRANPRGSTREEP